MFQAPHSAQWERYYAPTIYDGSVYVNGGYYGGMYGFDAFGGAQQWFNSLPQYDEWTPAVEADLADAQGIMRPVIRFGRDLSNEFFVERVAGSGHNPMRFDVEFDIGPSL